MKIIHYSLLASCILSSTLFASIDADSSLSQDHTYENKIEKKPDIQIVDGWEFSGDIRTGWVQYEYQNAPTGIDLGGNIIPTNPNTNKGHIDSKGLYVMPKISITSPKNSRIGAKVTLGGATDFGLNDEKYGTRTFVFDPAKRKSYIILQEVYLKYEDKNHKLLAGREELSTPMIDADDWYMFSNSFELAYYAYKALEDITIAGGYFSQMAGVWDSGADNSRGFDKTQFNSMSEVSYIDSADKIAIGDKGIYTVTFMYNDDRNHNVQVWDYYAEDMYNTLFIQYDYTNKIAGFSYDAGLQFINFKEVGYLSTAAAKTEEIDYSIYSARFDGNFDFGFNFATGVAKFTDGSGQGTTLGAFGGYPYFANGMIFHFFEAGSLQNAASYKAQIGYDILDNLWLGYRYTYFDLDPNFSKNANGQAQDAMKLNGIRLSYGGDKGTYFTGTYEDVNLDNEPNTYSLRLIGGYKF